MLGRIMQSLSASAAPTAVIEKAINALCDKGWIAPLPAEEDSRKKLYRLTDRGRAVLRRELARLQELVRNGESVLKEDAQ